MSKSLKTEVEELKGRVADLEAQITRLRSLVVNPVIVRPQYHTIHSPPMIPTTAPNWPPHREVWCEKNKDTGVWGTDQSGGV